MIVISWLLGSFVVRVVSLLLMLLSAGLILKAIPNMFEAGVLWVLLWVAIRGAFLLLLKSRHASQTVSGTTLAAVAQKGSVFDEVEPTDTTLP